MWNEKTRALAAADGLPLLDLDAAVPKEKRLFLDQVHVSPEGARVEAETAARFLAALQPSQEVTSR